MKKEVHPGLVAGAIAIVVLIVAVLMYRSAQPEPVTAMGPMGPGMAALKKSGGDMTAHMTPEEKQMMRNSMHGAAGGGTPNAGPAGMAGGK